MADQQLPPVKGGIIAYLNLDGAIKAADFYKKALAAEVAHIHPADEKGRTMHCHLYINGGSLMLSDPYPEQGVPYVAAAGYSLMLPVTDVDVWYDRAVKAGCTGKMPPADMFWGERYGQFSDPYGVVWAVVGPKKG